MRTPADCQNDVSGAHVLLLATSVGQHDAVPTAKRATRIVVLDTRLGECGTVPKIERAHVAAHRADERGPIVRDRPVAVEGPVETIPECGRVLLNEVPQLRRAMEELLRDTAYIHARAAQAPRATVR